MSFGDQFLAHPDLFPRRSSGERLGNERVRFDLAGGPYVIDGLSADLAEHLSSRYSPLVSPATPRDTVDLEAFAVEPSEFRPVSTAGWEYRLDRLLEGGVLQLAGLSLMARVRSSPPAQAVLWTSATSREEFLGPFENVLRVLVAYRLIAAGGLMLHSAGVVRDGRAWVFFGRSGAGKSTFAELSARAGFDVLSDELNLIWPHDGGAIVESLPFAGDFGQRCRARERIPLGGLFRLDKGPPCGRRRLPSAIAAATLVACSPTVNSDPSRLEELLSVVERLLRLAPPESLAFELASNPWSMLNR